MVQQKSSSNYATRTCDSNTFPFFIVKSNFFKSSFFPAGITERNKLDLKIHNSTSLATFKKLILKFMRPDRNSVLNIHETQGIKFLTRMHLGLSHVNDHKFRHNFQDCIITI